MPTTDHSKEEPGLLMPLISLDACEGKGPCVDACPYDVFAMSPISDKQFKGCPSSGSSKHGFTEEKKPMCCMRTNAIPSAYVCRPARKKRSGLAVENNFL